MFDDLFDPGAFLNVIKKGYFVPRLCKCSVSYNYLLVGSKPKEKKAIENGAL